MNSKKFLFSILVFGALLQAVNIPISKAEVRPFGKSLSVNAKIIQLSNAQQSVMSLLSGHIEKYYVQEGQSVKNGQKIARIDSIALSQMSAEYLSLKTQLAGLEKNYLATKTLYEKGMVSMQDLNLQMIERSAMQAKLQTLHSQLRTLGIDAGELKSATASYILKAHGEGRVAAILQPLHSVVNENTAIVSIIKDRAFYVRSFLPLRYASLVKKGQKVVAVREDGTTETSHVNRILPELDETTQRIILLSSIDTTKHDLYVNEYVKATLFFDADKEYVSIKKSALSFYQNEWVVFVPKQEHAEDTHEGHDHDEHQSHEELSPVQEREDLGGEDHDGHAHSDEEHQGELSSAQERDHLGGEEHDHGESLEKEAGHGDEHGGHDAHEDEEVPYGVRVVEIITEDEHYAAVKGLNAGEAYVSGKSYFVKSMLLKSSLGGHGH